MSSKTNHPSSKPVPPVPLAAAPPPKSHAESHAESHVKEDAASRDDTSEHVSEPALNQGQVHPGPLEPTHAKARLSMDQIDAVATPQGVVLFALTEGGDIWQLTTFSGQPEWHQILTPEAPAEDV